MSTINNYLPMKYWLDENNTLNKAYFEYEEDCFDSPREWENLGIIVNASGYNITGDKDVETKNIEEWLLKETGIKEEWYFSNYKRYGGMEGLLKKFIKEKCIAFEYLSIYEHSGVTIHCSKSYGWDNLNVWDYSNVGFIYIPKDNQEVKDYIRTEGKIKAEEWATGILENEVHVLRDWLEGNVYTLVNEVYNDESGEWEFKDSVGGIYLTSDTLEEEQNCAIGEIKGFYSGNSTFLNNDKVEKSIENGELDILRGQLLLDFENIA